MKLNLLPKVIAVATITVLVGILGPGCATDGNSSVHVHYGIGMETWWPHDYYWNRRPIHVGPPVYPSLPEPELPIEPPPDLIAIPQLY